MYTSGIKPFTVFGNETNYNAEADQIQHDGIDDSELYYFPTQPISDFFAVDILKVKSAVYQTLYNEIFPQKVNYGNNYVTKIPVDQQNSFFKNRFEFAFQTDQWTRFDEIYIRIPVCCDTTGMQSTTTNPALNLNQYPQPPWIFPQMIASIQIKMNDTIVVGTENWPIDTSENPVLQSLLNCYKAYDVPVIQKNGVPFHQLNSWGFQHSQVDTAYSMNHPSWELRNPVNFESSPLQTREVPLYFFSNLFKKSCMLPPLTSFSIKFEIMNVFYQLMATPFADVSPGYMYLNIAVPNSEDLTNRTRGIFIGLSQIPSVLYKKYIFTPEQENLLFDKYVSSGFMFNYVSLKKEVWFNNVNDNFVVNGTKTKFENVILNMNGDAPECLLFFVTLPFYYSNDKFRNSGYIKPMAYRNYYINIPSFTNKSNTRLLEFFPFKFKSIYINFDGRLITNYSNDVTSNSSSTLKFLLEQDTKDFFLEEDSLFPVNYFTSDYNCGSFIPIRVTNQNKYINRNVTNLNISNKQVQLTFEIVDLNDQPLPAGTQIQIYVIERKQIAITGSQIIKSTYPAIQTGQRIGTSEWRG